jgi:hypothetical protein
MFDLMVVQEALEQSTRLETNSDRTSKLSTDGLDTLISLLIHDIFGGEILKTHNKNGWHFYNRIDGLRIDFSGMGNEKPEIVRPFEDIPSSPDETFINVEEEEYTSFFMRFVRAFEEIIGLERFQPSLTT